jgi:hypothetical protein
MIHEFEYERAALGHWRKVGGAIYRFHAKSMKWFIFSTADAAIGHHTSDHK